MLNFSLIKLKIIHFCKKIYLFTCYEIWPAKTVTKRMFRHSFGRRLDLNNPTTLNEKINWLKLYRNINNPFLTLCADKYGVREYLEKEFGAEYLIPLLYQTTNPKDITKDTIPQSHCIIKATHDSGGHYFIIRENRDLDYSLLQEKFRYWLSVNYYNVGKEWQYKNIKPRIIIEQLLETKSGKIPNDYKLHFINGELQFIYVSYDREGINDRCTYDRDWNRLPFVWVPASSYREGMNTAVVPKPESLDKMIEFGERIAKNFEYVRVDFYDVDGKLYFGEITLHHGGGDNKFFPEEYDYIYGEKLIINK